jgi:IgGFc binding protein/Secretion system C-terminal sorting domain
MRTINRLTRLVVLVSILSYYQAQAQHSDLKSHPFPAKGNNAGVLQDLARAKAARSSYVSQRGVSVSKSTINALTRRIGTQKTVNGSSSKGKDFWVCFERNYDNVSHPLALKFILACDRSAEVRIAIAATGLDTTVVLPANVAISVEIPSPLDIVVNSSEVVEAKGIHVTADEDITLYGLNQMQYSTDAYLALPLDILDVSYLAMSYTGLGYESNQSQIAIVSPYDNVTVNITPSADTEGGQSKGSTISVTLNKGDVYQIRGAGTGDLTGTVVQSSLPVALFGGHTCAQVPVGVQACDHLVEEIPPLRTWGSRFATIPFKGRLNGDTFRMLSATNGTELRINGEQVATLDLGQFYETVLNSPCIIESSHPALVMQYANGDDWDPEISDNGDPFMMLVPPVEQFLNSYIFSTALQGFDSNYVSITVLTSDISGLQIDGRPLSPSLFQTIAGSEFSAASIPVSLGSHVLENLSGVPFGISCYGFASYDSYGYVGGLSLGFIQQSIAPRILLTPQTTNLFSGAQIQGAELLVSATVTDVQLPHVNSASLYYRKANSGDDYSVVPLIQGTDSTWSVRLSGAQVQEPGIQFYLSATNGPLTGTTPDIDPQGNPYCIAVLPNYPPVIKHSPVSSAIPGQDLTMAATITDQTNFVQSAQVFYRIRGGNPGYITVPMTALGNNIYSGVISGNEITSQGLEYFLKATDDLGISSYQGDSQNPHIVAVVSAIKLMAIEVRRQGEAGFTKYPLRTALGIQSGDEMILDGVVLNDQGQSLPGQSIQVYNPLKYDPVKSINGKATIATDGSGLFSYPVGGSSISLQAVSGGVYTFWFNVLGSDLAIPFCLVVHDPSTTVESVNNYLKSIMTNEPAMSDIHVDTSAGSPFRDLFIPAEAYPADDDNLTSPQNNSFFTFLALMYVGPTDEHFLLTPQLNGGWLRRGYDLYQNRVRNVVQDLPNRFRSILPTSTNDPGKLPKALLVQDYNPLETSNLWWYVGEGLLCLSTAVPSGVTQVIGPIGCSMLEGHLATDAIKTVVTNDELQKPFGLNGNEELDAGLELTVDVGSLVYSAQDASEHVAHWQNPRNFMHGLPDGRLYAEMNLIKDAVDLGKTGYEAWGYGQMLGSYVKDPSGNYRGTLLQNITYQSSITDPTSYVDFAFTRANDPVINFTDVSFDDPTYPTSLRVKVQSTRPIYEKGNLTETAPTFIVAGSTFTMEKTSLVGTAPFTYSVEIPTYMLPNFDPSNPTLWSETMNASGYNFETNNAQCEGGFCGITEKTLYLWNTTTSGLPKRSSSADYVASLTVPEGAFGGAPGFVQISAAPANLYTKILPLDLSLVSSVISISPPTPFLSPATLQIPFNPKGVRDPNLVHMLKYDENTFQWNAVQSTVNAADSTVETAISANGKFVLSVSNLSNGLVGGALAGLPKTYELFQNYPNPFNPTTTIRYGLPHKATASITIFNILGQLVTTLVNGEQQAGYHEVRFDGSNLASGVYFYRLQAGNFVQTKKLLLLH